VDLPDRRRDQRLREFFASLDEDMRSTLTQIHENYEDLKEDLAHDRRILRWAVRWLIALSVGLGIFVSLSILGERADDDQERRDRREAIVSACEARNEMSRANIAFIKRVAPRYTGGAIKEFPVERSCASYADRILGP
jgi:hypothetical protein